MVEALVAADTHHRRAAFRRPRWAAWPTSDQIESGPTDGNSLDEDTQQTLATLHGLFRLSVTDARGQSDVNQFQRHLGDAGHWFFMPLEQVGAGLLAGRVA